jgi:hypothetical protein
VSELSEIAFKTSENCPEVSFGVQLKRNEVIGVGEAEYFSASADGYAKQATSDWNVPYDAHSHWRCSVTI